MVKLSITVKSDGTATIISNDGSHGAHGPDNPDTGETSQFALDLAKKLEELGMETVVTRIE